MRVGSLFSGIGGIELGLERAGGFETVWFVENDKHAQAVLRKHWPNAEVYDDVATLDFATVPRVDMLTGGFPCQDISNAGRRAGITGSRSSLWKHYCRAISVLRPKIVFAENVAALTQRGLDTVLGDLASLGYDAEWHCVPASSVGAPHRRDRIVILAYPNNNNNRQQCEESTCEARGNAELDTVPNTDDAGQSDRSEQQGRESASSCEGKRGAGRCSVGTGNVANADDRRKEQEVCAGGNAVIISSEVSHPDKGRLPTAWSEQQAARTSRNGEQVSNANGEGLQRRENACGFGARWENGEQQFAGQSGWWAVEPRLGRVAHGVPHRVDRIKRLGNAVVPQWAQAIGEAIKEVERDQ